MTLCFYFLNLSRFWCKPWRVISTCSIWWLYKVIKRRSEIQLKEKFFKRNGGFLLQQQLSSSEHNVQNTKLFNSKELDIATDQFNESRILGKGGQGTVYKGMLTDGRIVAIKKCNKWMRGILNNSSMKSSFFPKSTIEMWLSYLDVV